MNKKYSLKEAQEFALQKGGKCLSEKYSTELIWQCKEGHVFKSEFSSVKKQNVWCSICAGNARLTIEHLQKIASQKNGKCLSNIYKNSKTKYEWQCEFGHVWTATLDNIRRGKWCPVCKRGQGEEVCRQFLEDLFQKSFIKIKPNWLEDPKTGYNLELDGYCEELNIAFEHQGRQHFALTEFTKTQEDLDNIQRKDKFKVTKCAENNTKLIIIPQVPDQIKFEDLKQFILNECARLNIIYDFNLSTEVNIKITPRVIKMLEKFKNIAEEHGGKCLSEVYVHDKYKLEFECKKGHRWFAFPTNVARGFWCKFCHGK